MIYLVAIFCSPLALLLAGKPVSSLFNIVLYVLAIGFWATLFFWHFGFFLWGIALLHAVLAIHDVRADRRARRVIARMRKE